MPSGRPSSYSQTVADAIVDAIAEGGWITEICERQGFPSYKTFRKWRDEHEDFSQRIAHAKRDQSHARCGKIVKLNESMNAQNWQHVNAQIRNEQWLIGKLNAADYGDRTAHELSGPNGNSIPLSLEIDV